MHRDKKLIALFKALRTECTSFAYSIPDHCERKPYMSDRTIIALLTSRYEKFHTVRNLKGCGQLTKDERKQMKIIGDFLNDLQ